MSCKRKNCICNSLEKLLKEQKQLAGESYQFVCNPHGMDTIPFMLTNSHLCSFRVFGVEENECFSTSIFRIEDIESDRCCASLTLLKAYDMDGCITDCMQDVYSIKKTDQRIMVDLSCFCIITPLPPKLVNRPLPIIEPKY
ncbi:CotY/CotZ family spore coat protein [Gracilibacillus suaedae]|uniref:CotY/CotZ family spore coat protein n=1 Tax=Gracilibacillus suaedae TaxID=2820273 RepID=UPI001ABE8F5F|nr:CotY/CotZ family spore coat protein [Gracilibacillus suaedae]